VRAQTIKFAMGVSESVADIQPTGFNNTIRWHLGHILTVQERLSLGLLGESLGIPDDYPSLFGNGTKPADWLETPATLATLVSQLEEQTARICTGITGRLEETLAKPFNTMETHGEVVHYSLFHEGAHLGFIRALQRAIESSNH
jgi:hypothetical protein